MEKMIPISKGMVVTLRILSLHWEDTSGLLTSVLSRDKVSSSHQQGSSLPSRSRHTTNDGKEICYYILSLSSRSHLTKQQQLSAEKIECVKHGKNDFTSPLYMGLVSNAAAENYEILSLPRCVFLCLNKNGLFWSFSSNKNSNVPISLASWRWYF